MDTWKIIHHVFIFGFDYLKHSIFQVSEKNPCYICSETFKHVVSACVSLIFLLPSFLESLFQIHCTIDGSSSLDELFLLYWLSPFSPKFKHQSKKANKSILLFSNNANDRITWSEWTMRMWNSGLILELSLQ